MFKAKSGFKSGKGPNPTNRPTSPPPGFRPMPPQGQMRQPLMSSRPPIQRRPIMGKSEKDKDFDETMKKLRDSGLIEVDFSGFGPSNGYVWTTSIFLKRNFDFKICQQLYPIGGLRQDRDE